MSQVSFWFKNTESVIIPSSAKLNCYDNKYYRVEILFILDFLKEILLNLNNYQFMNFFSKYMHSYCLLGELYLPL